MKKISFFKQLSYALFLGIFAACTSHDDTFKTIENSENARRAQASSSYSSWILGSTADVNTNPAGGAVLAGGSSDVDNAMRWMLENADGGDVIVFRNAGNRGPEAGDDAYNPYFYNELGVNVNSVETILLNSRSVAQNADVAQKTRNAEAVFFTGGDQYYYYDYISGTALEDALNYLVNTKGVTIGGTSAGCAIQGEVMFTAESGTVYSNEALRNPYNQYMDLDYSFINNPYLESTVTDTHYDNPDRRGRHITFMARMSKDYGMTPKGIGVDERTAVCVNESGRAYVYGSGTAFFLQQNGSSNTPEKCVSGKRLDWYRNRQAVEVYKINATSNGSRYFNLSNWNSGSGGSWSYFYVDNGRLKTN